MFHLFTGIYCPGCGGTRAFKFLIKGELYKSFCYHPLVIYMAAVILIEIFWWLVSVMLKKKWIFSRHDLFFIYLGIAITALNFIYKNYMLLVKGVDLLQ